MYFFKIRRIGTEPTWLSVRLTLVVRRRRLVWMVSGVFLWSCCCIVASWPFKHIFISSPPYTPPPLPIPHTHHQSANIDSKARHFPRQTGHLFRLIKGRSWPSPWRRMDYEYMTSLWHTAVRGPWDSSRRRVCTLYTNSIRCHSVSGVFLWSCYPQWVTQCTTKHRATFLSNLGFRQHFILEIQRQVCMWQTARQTEFDWQQRFL